MKDLKATSSPGSRLLYSHRGVSPISRFAANRDPDSRSRPNRETGVPGSRFRPSRESGIPFPVSRPNRESGERELGISVSGATVAVGAHRPVPHYRALVLPAAPDVRGQWPAAPGPPARGTDSAPDPGEPASLTRLPECPRRPRQPPAQSGCAQGATAGVREGPPPGGTGPPGRMELPHPRKGPLATSDGRQCQWGFSCQSAELCVSGQPRAGPGRRCHCHSVRVWIRIRPSR